MGAADTVTKAYMRENAIFADAFNYLIYDGRQVIKPDSLKELDTTEIALPFADEHEEAVQKYRDILKSAVVKQDDKAAYILLGIENQTDIHYAMPVRSMIYDALQYGKQVSEIAAKHRKETDGGHTKGEYLSGFYKGDKITPVITLVIHFGADEWDGPMSIHEMTGLDDYDILRFVPNYRINLIDPAKISGFDLTKFETSLREVLGYIKYSRNKDSLMAFIGGSERDTIEREAAMVIKTITKTPIDIPEGLEEINMCEAIEAMVKDSKAEGRAEGKAEGKAEGILETLASLVKDKVLTTREAAARAAMTEDEFKEAMAKLA